MFDSDLLDYPELKDIYRDVLRQPSPEDGYDPENTLAHYETINADQAEVHPLEVRDVFDVTNIERNRKHHLGRRVPRNS